MASSLLAGKRILGVDDETDVLDILQEELQDHQVEFERASTYEEAIQRMASLTYDLVILDIMGVRGTELLEYAVQKQLPVVMLTAHGLSPQSLKRSIELGARAYLPKDQLGQITPFLEDLLTLGYQSAWKSVLHRLGSSFGKRFAPDWKQPDKEFWEKFEKDLEVGESNVIDS